MEFFVYSLQLKKFFSNSLVAILVTMGLAAPAVAKEWSQIYEQSKPSIPLLVMSGGYCSGTLIEKDLVITAAHCVAPLRRLQVTWASQIGVFQDAKVVALDEKSDLALVRLSSPRAEIPLKVIAPDKSLRVGDPVATIGHPAQPDFKWGANFPFSKKEIFLMSSGIVSGIDEEDLITDLSLTPGNSGGPILNSDGELVAVVSRKRVGPAVGEIGFATSRTKIQNLIAELKKDGDQQPSIWKAKTSFEMSVSFMNGCLAQNERRSRFYSTGFEFRLALLDRLYLGYTGSFNGTPRYNSVMIGPKFVFSEKESHSWVLSPQLEYVTLNYIPDPVAAEVTENLWAYSLFVRTSRSPVALKVGYVPRKGTGEYFVNLVLPIF